MTTPFLIPIDTLPDQNISNLQLGDITNTTFSVAAGTCWDSTGTWSMTLPDDVTVNAAANGVNGLDVGALAANTLYAAYVIGDAAGFNAPKCILSLSSTIPFMPIGSAYNTSYNLYRRVGWMYTDASAHFLLFFMSGNSSERIYQWATQKAVLTAGQSSTFLAVSLASAMPLQATPVFLNSGFVPSVAGQTFSLRPTGSTITANSTPIIQSGDVASVKTYQSQLMIIPQLSGGNPSIDYVVSNAAATLDLHVAGFIDYV